MKYSKSQIKEMVRREIKKMREEKKAPWIENPTKWKKDKVVNVHNSMGITSLYIPSSVKEEDIWDVLEDAGIDISKVEFIEKEADRYIFHVKK